MSNQEVWITIRIKSELPVEVDAPAFAEGFVKNLWHGDPKDEERDFIEVAQGIEVIEIEEERHIYGLEG